MIEDLVTFNPASLFHKILLCLIYVDLQVVFNLKPTDFFKKRIWVCFWRHFNAKGNFYFFFRQHSIFNALK